MCVCEVKGIQACPQSSFCLCSKDIHPCSHKYQKAHICIPHNRFHNTSNTCPELLPLNISSHILNRKNLIKSPKLSDQLIIIIIKTIQKNEIRKFFFFCFLLPDPAIVVWMSEELRTRIRTRKLAMATFIISDLSFSSIDEVNNI